MEDDVGKIIGKKIHDLRVQLDWTMYRFAKELNTAHGNIPLWENGKRIPDTRILFRIKRLAKDNGIIWMI